MGHSSPEVHTFFPKHLTVRRVLESAWADAPVSKPSLDDEAKHRVSACLRWFQEELNITPSRLSARPSLTVLDQKFQSALTTSNKAEVAHIVDETQNLLQDPSALDWATQISFRDLPFSSQRLLLFLRSIVSSPDLVILDEAFSGMDAETRDKALLFLSHGETMSRVAKGNAGVRTSLLADMHEVRLHGLSEKQALLTISHSKEDVPGCVRQWICLPELGEGRAPRWGSLQGPLELNPEGWNEIWGV